MKISVITAVRNDPRVAKCMESVQSQSWSEVEHIVVDGMCTDSTPRVIGEKVDDSTKVIRERDAGLYDALNMTLFRILIALFGYRSQSPIFTTIQG